MTHQENIEWHRDIERKIIYLCNGYQSLQEGAPHLAIKTKNFLFSFMHNPEVMDYVTHVGCAELLNFMKKSVWDDAKENGHTVISPHGDEIIDQQKYRAEIDFMIRLNRRLTFSETFLMGLEEISDRLSAALSDSALSEVNAHFPYFSNDQKLLFADYLISEFQGAAIEKFGLPLQENFAHNTSSKNTKTAAYAGIIDSNDGKLSTAIVVTDLGLKRSLIDFTFIIQHELVHNLIQQAYILADQDFVTDPDKMKNSDMGIAWITYSNAKTDTARFPDLYAQDLEEDLCNYIAARTAEPLLRFTPKYQITHQPLLEI